MNHQTAENSFLDAIEGTMSDAHMRDFETHLSQCSQCSKAFREYRALTELENVLAQESATTGPSFVVSLREKIENRGLDHKALGWFTVRRSALIPFATLATICVALVVAKDIQRKGDVLEPVVVTTPVEQKVIQSENSPKQATESAVVVPEVHEETIQQSNPPELAAAETKKISPEARKDKRKVIETVAGNMREDNQTSEVAINDLAPVPSRNQKSVPPYDSLVARSPRTYREYFDIKVGSIGRGDIAPVINNERYGLMNENARIAVSSNPLSTFSLDIDTGSYTNVRRFLKSGNLPPPDAVRTEEFINYFSFEYPQQREKPFSVNYEVGISPFDSQRYLLKLGVRAKDAALSNDAGWNLVFLIDVSGSMTEQIKLPLIKRSLSLLVNNMRSVDRIAIVTYSDSAQTALPSTSGSERQTILNAIERLAPGGGTNGSAGIDLAYSIAEQNRNNGGVNRIVLATDGDFNVGNYSFDGLMNLIEQKRESGITLTTLGVGDGNYNEHNLEQLADRGNGNYFYLDSLDEARRVLLARLTANMEVIAKDVKVQVEFNPQQVAEWRLLGYENRALAKEDFKNDRVDAGEVGAGHTVTAIYELLLKNSPNIEPLKPELRYQDSPVVEVPAQPANTSLSGELGFVKIRFKSPNDQESHQLEFPVHASDVVSERNRTSNDFRFASAVAAFAELLRHGQYATGYSYADVLAIARDSRGADIDGKRAEFIQLVETARGTNRPQDPLDDYRY